MAKGHDPGMTTNPATGTATATATESEAATSVLRMIWGIHISRAVYLAAELGIADLLADGPVDSTELARATGTHAPSLYRVLRLLAALHVLDEVEPRTFANTVLGERLRTGAPAGLRSWATFLDAIGATRAFEYIGDTVRTGRPAFEPATGRELFASLAENPAAAAAFDAAMSERTAAFAPSGARGYDFSDLRTVVDGGGGAAGRGRCWWRSWPPTRTSTACCSKRPRWPPAPTRYSTRSTYEIAARSNRATSSTASQTERTATCSPTSCTTGTTMTRSRSWPTAVARWRETVGC